MVIDFCKQEYSRYISVLTYFLSRRSIYNRQIELSWARLNIGGHGDLLLALLDAEEFGEEVKPSFLLITTSQLTVHLSVSVLDFTEEYLQLAYCSLSTSSIRPRPESCISQL